MADDAGLWSVTTGADPERGVEAGDVVLLRPARLCRSHDGWLGSLPRGLGKTSIAGVARHGD